MPDLNKVAENLKTGAESVRNMKSTRIWFMVGLIVILFLLWWLKIIKTGFAIGIGILILAAIGVETFNYDLDLGKLWETGDIQASRVSHTKDGLKLMGNCALPTHGEKNDLDCKNFSTQKEAQTKYDQCADEIASYNDGVDAKKVKSLDIYGLDGDNDEVVCEALPQSDKKTEPKATIESTGSSEEVKTPAPKKSTSTKKIETKPSENTYSRTPTLNSDKPFPISEATIRTNPKVLPAQ